MSNAPYTRTSGGVPVPSRTELGGTYRIEDLPTLEVLSLLDPEATIHQDRLLQNILNHAYNGYPPAYSLVRYTEAREDNDISEECEDNDIPEECEDNDIPEECEEPLQPAVHSAEDPFHDSDRSIVESFATLFNFVNNFYGPVPTHASAEQINTNIDTLMQIYPGLLAAEETAMDPLSPRTTNAKISSISQKPVTKQDAADVANAKLAAAQKAQKEKDHAPAPPPMVYQPEGPSGEPAEKYRTGRLLGKGGFAICHEGELRGKRYGSRGHRFALKIVRAEMSQKRMQEKV